MASSFHGWKFSLSCFVLSLSIFAAAQENCNTQANPSCAGDARFARICCSSPNVCYFQDRLGTPGCCPAGQTCGNNGQYSPRPVATIAPNSAVSLSSSFGQITASMSIMMFTTNSISLTAPAAAFSTVGGLLVGAARPIAQAKEATPLFLPIMLIAWNML